MDDQTTNADTIRELNDRFRQGLVEGSDVPGRIVLTSGISGLAQQKAPVCGLDDLMGLVRAFDAFDADNDPYGEHDFGAFDFLGARIFFKIDYFDNTLSHGSSDPADVDQTTRVLTIMLAEEY